MAILAAIIDRQFETHVDDVLVVDQVVAFPDGDHSERFVVGQFNRDEAIIVLRRYFPVQVGNIKKVSTAGDEFLIYEFKIQGTDADPQLILEDEPSMVIPVAISDVPSAGAGKESR
ncbi:hypothetical protein [Rhizobium sp. MHM7A]|uniref:hypothetical protein n=1 Tax=Rhizobium sp. MHM7A TaxID=2583233 RepID=UPI001105B4F0|nr:hypothetical protein [Rhizobium sp. MHM7A]TLX16631.1 hypothetical protein FFR93_04630 [Rhizobium sp. MHM7A]